ncbi:MAG: MoxR family ATPase [Clostridia bacterium]|nr:MoxR family ATPase [Clostridia bacterium]
MDNRNAAILNEVKKVIVGKDDVLQKVLMTILAGGHVLLEDVPGTGKTTLALAFSKAMNLAYNRVQFTPDTMASDVIGFSVYNKDTGDFEYRRGAIICNFFLGDEINRTSAKTQAALLEVMEEMHATVDGVTYQLPDPFVCMATQNPLGSAGTHPLPDSQLDRFMVRLSMGYPTIENTIEIVQLRQGVDPLDSVRAVATAEDIRFMRSAVTAVYIDESLIRYAAELCDRTRHLEEVEQGVSPRAVLALVQMAKASAYMRGRNYVVPEDIQSLYTDVCAHRLILTPRAKIRKRSPEQILLEVLKTVKAPAPATRRK